MKGRGQEGGVGLNEGDCHLDQSTAPVYSSLPNSVAGSESRRARGIEKERRAGKHKKASLWQPEH